MSDDVQGNVPDSDDGGPDDLGPLDFNVDDLEREFQAMMEEGEPAPQRACRALVLSPVDAPGALRAALDLVGSPAPVVGVGGASAVFLEAEEDAAAGEEAEMLALLGEDRPLPEPVDQMARLLSKLSAKGAVAIAAWTSKAPTDAGGEELSGNIVARRYVNGEPEAPLSSGLVLSGLNLAAEELLLGRMQPDEVDEHRGGGPWTGWLKGRGKR